MIKPGGVGRGLTREQIVAAAFAVLDEHGLDGLTMRRVAGRLGVQAAALYWHVSDKADLLDEMGTSMWRTATVPLFREPDQDVARGLTDAARSFRATMLAHRDGATVFAGGSPTSASSRCRNGRWRRWWRPGEASRTSWTLGRS